jgi:large subunit ribosomal protein L4
MSSLTIYNQKGEKLRELEPPSQLFAGPIRMALLYYVVNSQRAKKRAGTHATKTRGLVRGSTKKIYRQKGTGNARHGDIKAPIFVGGGKVFGPHPRDYSYRLPKSAMRRALQTALALRNKEGNLKLIENFAWNKIKTKTAVLFFKSLKCESALIVIGEKNPIIEKSIQNLKKFKVLIPEGLNVLDILKYDQLILTEEGFNRVLKRIGTEEN